MVSVLLTVPMPMAETLVPNAIVHFTMVAPNNIVDDDGSRPKNQCIFRGRGTFRLYYRPGILILVLCLHRAASSHGGGCKDSDAMLEMHICVNLDE